jgi:primosomal protein N' (replication factor Y)
MTAASNYIDFADRELAQRSSAGYPPFRKMLRIIVSCEDRSVALQHASTIARIAKELSGSRQIEVQGPAPAPIERIRALWRYNLVLKSNSAAELQHVMKVIKRNHRPSQETRVSYDLDPHDML